jgi:hypothetical protein
MQQLRVPFSITVGGSLSANGQVVPDLLNSQGMGFVSANALLSIQAVIDPPPHPTDQVYFTLQRKTGNQSLAPISNSSVPVVRDGTVGSGPAADEGIMLSPTRVAQGDSLTLLVSATGTAGDVITGRMLAILADVA